MRGALLVSAALLDLANALRTSSPIMKASLPHDFVSVHAKYSLANPADVLPAFALPVMGDDKAGKDAPPSLCDEYMELARTETGMSYCGLDALRSQPSGQVVGGYMSVPDDTLFARAAYTDANAVLRHLEAVKAATDKIGAKAPLKELSIHGPAKELAICKASLGESASYFELLDGGYSSLKKVADGVPLTLTLLSVHTTLKVSDWSAAQPLMDGYVDVTSKEGGCVFCGFSRCGDTLFLREAFGSVPDIGKHIENAGSAMDALIAGPATLESSSVHGGRVNVLEFMRVMREGKLDGVYGDGSGVKADVFWKEVGIQRFERAQSMFGFTF